MFLTHEKYLKLCWEIQKRSLEKNDRRKGEGNCKDCTAKNRIIFYKLIGESNDRSNEQDTAITNFV